MFSERENEVLVQKNKALAGAKAKDFMASEWWPWFKNAILGALEDKALMHLKNGKTDEDRLAAQQMYLASQQPEVMLNYLVTQGHGALQALEQLTEESNGTSEEKH